MSILDINSINYAAFRFVDSIASSSLNTIMVYLAISFVVVFPAIIAYLFYKKDKNAYSFALSIVVLFIIGDILKIIIKEPRPCSLPDLSWINNLGCESSFSFPSDHAMTLAGPILLLNNYGKLRVLYAIWVTFLLFGRVYLGLHYFTDVIAGLVISLILGYAIYIKRNIINEKTASIASRISNRLRV